MVNYLRLLRRSLLGSKEENVAPRSFVEFGLAATTGHSMNVFSCFSRICICPCAGEKPLLSRRVSISAVFIENVRQRKIKVALRCGL